jgi:formylglycine-generating enzyme required for sulfatase activity
MSIFKRWFGPKKEEQPVVPAAANPPPTGGPNVIIPGNPQIQTLVCGTQINHYIQVNNPGLTPQQIETSLIAHLRDTASLYDNRRLDVLSRGDDGYNILHSVALDQAYVPATTELTDAGNAAEVAGQFKVWGSKFQTDHLLKVKHSIVLTGEEGCGKSVALMRLGALLARMLLDKKAYSDTLEVPNTEKAPLPVPVYVPLNLYAQRLRELAGNTGVPHLSLGEFIDQYLRHTSLGLPTDFFSVLIEKNIPTLLLLDGLDEIVDEGWRETVAGHLAKLATRDQVRFVVSCRKTAYAGRAVIGPAAVQLAFQPFDRARLEKVVEKAYFARYPEQVWSGPDPATVGSRSLLAGIDTLEALREKQLGTASGRLINSPLMTHLALIVHDANAGKLPVHRGDLLMQAIDLLLSARHDPTREQALGLERELPPRRHLALLAACAHHLQLDGITQTSQLAVEDVIGGAGATPQEVAAVIAFAQARGALLIRQANQYQFRHSALQQVLCAMHLCITHKSAQTLADTMLADGRIGHATWRETAYLAGGYHVTPGSPVYSPATLARYAIALAGGVQNTSLTPQSRFNAVETAGQLIEELLPSDSPTRAQLAPKLGMLMEDYAAMDGVTPQRRADIGALLGRYGEIRPHVRDVDAMRFCLIPPGRFLMGSTDDEMAYDDEKSSDTDFNTHGVDIPYPYATGQLPVTNLQYATFVAENGYTNLRWWDVAIKAGVWKDGKLSVTQVFRQFGEDPRTSEEFAALLAAGGLGHRTVEVVLPREFEDRLARYPNHPVRGLTWYEALAFCEWLQTRWRTNGRLPQTMQLTLPSEAEWEKAARGGDKVFATPVIGDIVAMGNLAIPEVLPVIPNRKRYPWGDMPDASKSNWYETGLGATCASGAQTSDRSVYGCMDMAGNTADWTRSLFGQQSDPLRPANCQFPYPYVINDATREDPHAATTIARTLRGGAFDFSQWDARVALRYWGHPDVSSNNAGFRVVVRARSS